ncbi:MAG: hypothetical protein AAF433_12905 [Bacteroidota bacterium]
MRFFPLLLLLLLLTSCQADAVELVSVEKQLLGKLLNQPEVEKLMGGAGVLAIDATYYCADQDCATLFDQAEAEVIVYSPEEAFVRNILTLRIYEYSVTQDEGFIQYSIGWNGKIRTLDY